MRFEDNVEKHWVPDIRKIPGKRIPFLLVGTKKDLRASGEAVVTYEQGNMVARWI